MLFRVDNGQCRLQLPYRMPLFDTPGPLNIIYRTHDVIFFIKSATVSLQRVFFFDPQVAILLESNANRKSGFHVGSCTRCH
jgi:hypothetical protein